MAHELEAVPIHNLYAQRFAADLEANRLEQAGLTTQISELSARLAQLKSDEGWLRGLQDTLTPTPPEAAAPDAPSVVSAVPPPRRRKKPAATTPARVRKTTPSRTQTQTPTAKDSATPASATAAAPTSATGRTTRKAATAAAEKAAEVTSAQAAVPPLRELVLDLLAAATEPRMVGEIASALGRANPGRPVSVQAVRNTLEGLAKKGLVTKEHRQGSVTYAALQPSTDRTAPSTA
ncbi:hypothetical protein ACFWUW_14090 [Streptomyces sp. NPDC058655]|uniref:hypothetical protein n=1 Tax=Streptomyces sp. NPDC058655 TaxID=3346577 RepID=UPI00366687C1